MFPKINTVSEASSRIKKGIFFLELKNSHTRDQFIYDIHLARVTKSCLFKYPYDNTDVEAIEEGTILH